MHLEDLQQHADGYRYTAFCERYREWLRKQRISMRQTPVAGDKMFVDCSGKKPHRVDALTGEVIDVELFVGAFSWRSTAPQRFPSM